MDYSKSKKIQDIYSLTPLQEGLLFNYLKDEECRDDIVQQIYKCDENLQEQTFIQSLKLISKKHAILRTSIMYQGMSKPRQVVLIDREIDYQKINCTDSKENHREILAKILEAEMDKGFDIQKDCLFRVRLVEFGDCDKYLVTTQHHIILDAWSHSNLIDDLQELYIRLSNGESFDRLEIECNQYGKSNAFGEFVHWINKQDRSEALAYWTKLCENYNENAGIIPMEEEQEVKDRVAYEELRLNKGLTLQLMQLAKKKNATINNIYEAAWGILLQKYNNCNDVIFGKVVTERDAPIDNIENAVGLFINTIPIRVTTDENMTLEQLLADIKKQDIDAKDYAYCSLAEIQSELSQKEDLLKTAITFVNLGDSNADHNILEKIYSRQTTTYGLSVNVFLAEECLISRIRYNPSIYKKEEIRLLAEHLELIFKCFVKDSTECVKSIDMCTDYEVQKINQEFNNTKVEYPKNKTIIELFEEQVKKVSDVCAIKCADKTLTYYELNQKANALGKYLREFGVGRDHLVGIMADRGIEMIIGIYGILKAGGAYVPIDPTYPTERIRYILQDSELKILLVNGKKRPLTEEEMFCGIVIVYIGDIIEDNAICEDCLHVNQPEDLAYIIYTSGTTGNPKGVMIKNQGVVNYCYMTDRNVHFGAYSDGCRRMISVGNFTFDIFINEAILSLLNGMTVYMTTQHEQNDYEAMCELMDRESIEIMITTPTRMRIILNTHNQRAISKLKYIVLGGEALGQNLVQELEKVTHARVLNGYGPTEITVAATYGIVNGTHKITIGKPISNTQVLIMQDDKFCGMGVMGELCISGDGLARGYLNREDLTASKFVQRPDNNEKMYRTGDLARWTMNGDLEYLGRMDDQVKIHGYRVELQEIENQMLTLPGILDCTVVLDKDSQNDMAICAYVVSNSKVDIIGVQDALRHKLPDYMVPSYYMQIDAVPQTSNGKVDKRALPKIQRKSYREYVAPKNDIELRLCQIFEKELSIGQIGINDNFFELGGHSLKAMSLVNQIEADLKIHLGVHEVFDTPTVMGLYEKIKTLKEEDFKPIPLANGSEFFPMSTIQRRIYLACQLDKEGVSYNIPQIFQLQGDLDIAKIKNSVEQIINRNEIFRTEFIEKDGELLQHIIQNVEPDYFEFIEDIQTDEKELVNKFIRPFQLQKAPLLRVRVVKRTNNYLLMIDTHHIVNDGTSNSIIFNELSRGYNGECINAPLRQYKDYSEWMRQRDFTAQKNYWVDQFKEEVPVLELPLDFTRKHNQSFKGEVTGIEIESDIVNGISELMKKKSVSEYMVFLSVLMILLSKYGKKDDVVVGVPFSARTHKDTERMIGMFVNTLALRGKPNSSKSFGEFLDEIRKICFNAYDNCEYPFEELVEAVNVKRDLSRNPIFDVMLALHNNEESQLSLRGIKSEYVKNRSSVSKFDLSFSITRNENQMQLRLRYCSDLFTKQTADRMIEQFVCILGQIIQNNDILIQDISVLLNRDKKMIESVNDTKSSFENEKTIVDLFEEQVIKTPDNIAVRYENRTITYKELNQKANLLARKLCELGIKPNDFVVIFTKRSIEMVVALYGVLKVGGAYVPISPSYPNDRIQYMIEDCQPKAIICYETLINCDLPIFDLDDQSIWVGDCSNLAKVNRPNDCLYCTYTSGTTGTPKGIPVRHEAEVNLITWYKKQFQMTELTKNTIISPLSFDLAQRNIFGVHTSGGALCLFGDEEAYDAFQYAKYISDYSITMLNCAASAFYALLFADQKSNYDNLKSLKKIYLVGEALSYEKLKKFLESPNCCAEIYNGYGATEDSGVASAYLVTKDDESRTSIPIGKPINNKQIYVMDEDKLCGIGMEGELCICGVGVTDGYLNNVELTERKFVENPFAEGKMYRTGDLGRWLPDGNLEFLGRMDEQVKVRGYRVELGEIENNLKKLDYIKDTAVVAREDDQGTSISAYVVSDKEVKISEVREYLLKALPEYMVPEFIGQIERIPVTSNGKLDRKALPVLKANAGKKLDLPINETEKILCQIYEEVLKADQISVDDGFFELGGHSLRALMVINRIEEEFGVNISVQDIFSNTTVRELSRLIQSKEHEVHESIPVAMQMEYYPMSSAQKRAYIVSQIDEGGFAYHMPYFRRITGDVDPVRIENAAKTMIQRHEILRTEFVTIDGELMQHIVNDVDADYQFISDCESTDKKLIQRFMQPFFLDRAPLFRIYLVKQKSDYVFMLDMHHIISDGMSIGTFLREFSALYNQEQLPQIKRQFKDYSEWMRTRDLSKQKEYWIREFGDEIPVLDMPLDYVRPREQSFRGSIFSYKIEKDMWNDIQNFARQNSVTEYMVFLSATMILLSKYSRQEDIIIGSPISARTHKDTESMLGMFVNTLAMRGKPSGKKHYEDFLKEIKETCLKAYENQEYPFEELVEEIKIPRDMARNPLFDVMLVLQNNEKTRLCLDGISTESIATLKNEVKFDLTFKIFEGIDSYDVILEYCTDLFRKETAEWILKHFSMILRQVIQDKYVLLDDIDMTDQPEKKLILERYNQTEIDYGTDRIVLDLFEEQVAKTPDGIAVIDGNRELTYRELNEKANQLARRLKERGTLTEDFVAILAKRSMEVIVAIYGTLKVGGAYVPINPDYPQERIDYILKTCRPKIVLTYDYQKVADFQCLDLADDSVYSGESTNLLRACGPKNLAYCIFTSGTTGKPKGVLIEHANLYNYIMYAKDHYTSGLEVMPFFSNIAFDLTVTTIFMPLVHGDCIKVYGDDVSVDEMMNDETLDIVKMTPSHLKLTLESLLFKGSSKVNCMILGGEGLLVGTANETLKRYGTNVKIHNEYGPTETTVGCCDYVFDPDSDTAINVLIGKPISNTKIYILNEDRICGIGVPGEICVSGAGVGRGYYDLPEETKTKFVKSPFNSERMYRTGDLGRWLPDGNLECLGRIDSQIKIHGFRIELGEIKKVILQTGLVKDVTVIAKNDSKGEKSIYAYYVSDDTIDKLQILQLIRKELPGYMIPNYIGQIEQIPLTSNGKVNVGKLPEISMELNDVYVSPSTKTETEICQLFSDILNVSRVGSNDNFFSLGGNSLNAIHLINQIWITLSVRIRIKDVFLNPTIKELASYIDHVEKKNYTPIPSAEEKENYLMSPSQKRTYIVSQMDEGGMAYNIPMIYRLMGEVSVARIKKALEEILERHEILRTEFLMKGNEFVQRIRDNVELDFEYIEDSESEEKKLGKDFQKPFKLDKAPLFRVKMVKRRTHFLFMMEFHHIICDGVSITLFMNELTDIYNGKPIKAVSCQYKDFSEWFSKQDLELQKEYWMNQFKEDIPVLDFPLDHKRPLYQVFHGDVISVDVDNVFFKKIKEFIHAHEITDYMLFLSALMILLNKYTRQEDIVVGTPVSARIHKDIEKSLGMFINTLAMRGEPKKEKECLQFLDEMKQICIRAYENQEYPFEELVEAVNVQRDASRNPLFDIMLSIQNNESPKFNLNGIQITNCNYSEKTSKFDLTFNIYERKNQTYGIALRYCTDIIDASSAKGIIDHYLTILQQVVQNPNRVIGSMEAITDAEKDWISDSFNRTDVEYERTKTVVKVFEEQVRRTPDRIAIIQGDRTLTYGKLNKKANQIARRLRKLELKADDLVVIIADKSPEMIIGIYGILKAGVAYIPVNPSYPEKRIQYIIDDSKAKAIVIYHADAFMTDNVNIPIINLGNFEIYSEDGDDLSNLPAPENLAYCIYTSGTTGKPKGVMVEHHNLMNYVDYASQHYLTEDVCMPLFSNFSFDLTATTLFVPLMNGGRIKIFSDDILVDQIFRDDTLTTIKLTPAHLKMVLNSNNYQKLNHLKTVILGGDNLPVKDSREFLRIFGDHIKIHNEYGPTEATIGCCDYVFENDQNSGLYVSIGKPLANVKIYIMNGESLCGVGVPGELCITGECVTRGYLNQTQLTESKFVPNPFGKGKMYRSGDLARWTQDGNIDCIGRIDQQVKIRGYRVEIEEIKNVIEKYPGIEDCAISIRNTDVKALDAYVVSKEALDILKLREYLRDELPNYMVPSNIGQVREIPLNKNGKVDFDALRQVETVKLIQNHQASVNEIEEKILEIWEEVIGKNELGTNDNFFDLGGTSLDIMVVHEKIEKIYPDLLRITDLFSYPTIKKLANHVSERMQTDPQIPLAWIQMPHKFLAESAMRAKNNIYQSRIDKENHEKLIRFVETNGVQVQDVLIAIYCYWLAKTCNNEFIEIQAMISDEDMIRRISIDFGEIDDMKDAIESIHGIAHDNHQETYEYTEICNCISKNNDRNMEMLLPLFMNSHSGQFDYLSEYFDILLNYEEKDDMLCLEFGYGGRVSDNSSHDLTSEYVSLLEGFIEMV